MAPKPRVYARKMARRMDVRSGRLAVLRRDRADLAVADPRANSQTRARFFCEKSDLIFAENSRLNQFQHPQGMIIFRQNRRKPLKIKSVPADLRFEIEPLIKTVLTIIAGTRT